MQQETAQGGIGSGGRGKQRKRKWNRMKKEEKESKKERYTQKERQTEREKQNAIIIARADELCIKVQRLLKNHFNVCFQGMKMRTLCSNTSIQHCCSQCFFLFLLLFPMIPNQILWLPAGFYASHKWYDCQTDKHTITQS